MVSNMYRKASNNDEIYTPPQLFEKMAARFDLDVCAPKEGLSWIPANKFYSIEDDSLIQNWHGFVWCNPPYSNPKEFVNKFINHANGIMLISVSRSKAFIDLWNKAEAIAWQPHDFKFVKNDLSKHAIFMPVVLAGFGTKALDAINRSGFHRVR